MAKPKKSGSLYKQKGSKFWWVKYYLPGNPKPIRESTKTEDAEEATTYLHRRMGDVATGKFAGLEPERIRCNELFDMVVEDYESNERSSIGALKSRLKKHIRPYFGGLRAAVTGTRQLAAYKAKRKKDGAENSTINRELEIVRRAFKMGFDAEPQLVLKALKVDKLSEDNIREGILEHSDYRILLEALPDLLYRAFYVCGYHLGTRKGELNKLQWPQIDLERNEITLKRYNTKTKKPRILPIYGDMKPFLLLLHEARDPKCPWVFQKKGKLWTFGTRTWNRRVKKAGLAGLHFHDLRRTAITNMVDAGYSEKEAMEISGHTTRGVFDRYHIIRRGRLAGLVTKMEEYFHVLEQNNAKGAASGIVPGIATSSDTVN